MHKNAKDAREGFKCRANLMMHIPQNLTVWYLKIRVSDPTATSATSATSNTQPERTWHVPAWEGLHPTVLCSFFFKHQAGRSTFLKQSCAVFL